MCVCSQGFFVVRKETRVYNQWSWYSGNQVVISLTLLENIWLKTHMKVWLVVESSRKINEKLGFYKLNKIKSSGLPCCCTTWYSLLASKSSLNFYFLFFISFENFDFCRKYNSIAICYCFRLSPWKFLRETVYYSATPHPFKNWNKKYVYILALCSID